MNTKMIRYILGKMLGVEAALLLLPALVSLIYREFSGVYFLVPSVIEYLREGGHGHRLERMDSLVSDWGAAVYAFRKYPGLSGCVF